MKTLVSTGTMLLASLCLAGCGGGSNGGGARSADPYTYRPPPALGDGWAVDTLAATGVDEERLVSMMDAIDAQGHDAFLRNILVVKDGNLVFEEYFGDVDVNRLSHLQSATKSIVSAIFGYAVANGYVASVDDAVFGYFPEYSHLNSASKDAVQVRHILTMTPGFDWNENSTPTFGTENDNIAAYQHGNYIEYVLQKDLVTTPGAAWNYNSGCPMILAGIIRNQAGIHIDEFADLHLFGPLGIEDRLWEYQADGLPLATGGLWLRARDSAKLGQVFLDDGQWQGQQVVPPDWVADSLTAQVSIDARGYGYLWWTRQRAGHRLWYAAGYGGQLIILVPDAQAVIVVNANYTRDSAETGQRQNIVWQLLDSYVLPAI
jgi:CubicO group peptidase (beta-lactamase class C family)